MLVSADDSVAVDTAFEAQLQAALELPHTVLVYTGWTDVAPAGEELARKTFASPARSGVAEMWRLDAYNCTEQRAPRRTG